MLNTSANENMSGVVSVDKEVKDANGVVIGTQPLSVVNMNLAVNKTNKAFSLSMQVVSDTLLAEKAAEVQAGVDEFMASVKDILNANGITVNI